MVDAMSGQTPTFAAQKKAWASPPLDDIGYLPSTDLLAMDDREFLTVLRKAEENRYGGWRNLRNRWIDILRIDDTKGRRVLDYGCGVGIEALQFVPDNRVWVADIAPANLEVTKRLFKMARFDLRGAHLITGRPPFLALETEVDVIHCSGVLHHIPDPIPVIKRWHELLAEGGEVRLMLYSDKAWIAATGDHPPPDDVAASPLFERYVRHWDAVGGWADWYDRARLEGRVGEWFEIRAFKPITRGGEYVGAVLVKR